jgi:hypothetical protein
MACMQGDDWRGPLCCLCQAAGIPTHTTQGYDTVLICDFEPLATPCLEARQASCSTFLAHACRSSGEGDSVPCMHGAWDGTRDSCTPDIPVQRRSERAGSLSRCVTRLPCCTPGLSRVAHVVVAGIEGTKGQSKPAAPPDLHPSAHRHCVKAYMQCRHTPPLNGVHKAQDRTS